MSRDLPDVPDGVKGQVPTRETSGERLHDPGSPEVHRKAVEAACVEWQHEILLFLTGILHSRHLVDDAWQRTVLQALQAARTVRLQTLRGWLFQIALNEARRILRETRKNHLHNSTADFTQSIDSANSGSTPSAPELLAIHRETQKVVQDCLQSLPPEHREVIHQRIYLGRTFTEISASLQVPLGTVLTWCRRGILRLKDDPRLKDLMKD